jgi:MoaA/NifB/PqqE/SkfB family radical SAM enzyme
MDTKINPHEVIWQFCPESQCPYNCAHCMARHANQGELPLNEKMIILEKLIQASIGRIALSGGEPLLHPELEELVKTFANLSKEQKKEPKLYVCTTGVGIEDLNLPQLSKYKLKLRVSFHITESSCELYSITTQQLKRLIQICVKFDISIEINTLLLKGFSETARIIMDLIKQSNEFVQWNLVSPYKTKTFGKDSSLWPTELDRQEAIKLSNNVPIKSISNFILTGQLEACRPSSYILFIDTLGHAAKCLLNPQEITRHSLLLNSMESVYSEAKNMATKCCNETSEFNLMKWN